MKQGERDSQQGSYWKASEYLSNFVNQAPVVQKVDNTIHLINLYPVDNTTGFPNT